MAAGYGIATPERAATAAGLRAFEAGGNAIDAALAAAATLTVTYPHNCGLGGDLFALVRAPSGSILSVNASGYAPALADPEAMRGRGERMPLVGAVTATVPGVVAGWQQVHAAGAARPWPEMFRDAIEYAERGFPVPRSLAAAIEDAAGDIDADPGMRAVFRPGGASLRAGDALAMPALAGTLRALAAGGPRAFYAGRVGRRLLEGLLPLGSPLRLHDLAGFRPQVTPPLRACFCDCEVLTSPPNSSGILLLQALAALDAAGAGVDPLGADAPFLAEVLRRGAHQRDAALADPRMAAVDLDAFLGETRIAELVAAGAGPAVAGVEPRPAGDTVAVVAADASGRAVSLIQSLFHAFGARVLEPGTGIILHNRGSFFSLEPGHPNELRPGKRPAHTLMPVLVQRDGQLAGVLGTMGGKAHAQIHAQVLLRLLAGDTAQAAVAAPRWIVGSLELGEPDDTVRVESGTPAAVRASLERAGMPTIDLPARSEGVGHAQALWSVGGGLDVGTDPRADSLSV